MEAHLYSELARQEDRHWWFQGRRAVLRSVLDRHLPPPPRRILDVGCGTGGNLRLLREFGEVEGLELSDVALELCRERVGPEIKLRRGAIPGDIPQGGRYDAVTALDVLEHLDDPVAAVNAIRGALRPGGTLICSVPAFAFLWSSHDEVHHHRRRYTQPLLRAHLEAGGLRVRWSSYFNTLLFAPIVAARAVGRLRGRTGDGRGSDLADVPRPLNKALAVLFASERHLLTLARLPVGVSLVAVAEAVHLEPGCSTSGGERSRANPRSDQQRHSRRSQPREDVKEDHMGQRGDAAVEVQDQEPRGARREPAHQDAKRVVGETAEHRDRRRGG